MTPMFSSEEAALDEIVQRIEATGADSDTFDIDGIFNETFRYSRQLACYVELNPDAFWQIVQERSA